MDRIESLAVLHPHRATIDAALEELAPDRPIAVWTDPAELLRNIAGVDALIVSVPPRGIWAAASRLRLVHLAGVGAEGLLPAPDLPGRVRIACARGLFAAEVAEHVIAVMLAMVRRLPELLDHQRHAVWRRAEADTVCGKTLGILGLGAIGQRVARVARALGMRVVATRRSAAAHPDADAVFGPDRTDEVLAGADVIVVALPSTPATRGSLGAAALARCRPQALLVNVARGGIVDEAAVADALVAGRLGGAALDVFEREPLPAASPLWGCPGVLVTPHGAGFGRRYATRLLAFALQNVARLEAGAPLLGEVDRDRGY